MPTPLALSFWDQLAWTVSGLGIKPTYMLLALALAVIPLRGVRDRDLRLLRWGLWGFFVGEAFCAVNAMLPGGESDLVDLGHVAGMLVMWSLFPWALFRILDDRALRFTDPEAPCALVRLCRRCWKKEPVTCGLHRLMLFTAPVLAVVSLLPLAAPLLTLDLSVDVFGSHLLYQVTPFQALTVDRVLPLVGAAGFLLATGCLLAGRRGLRWAELGFFAAFGFFGFGLMRFGLLRVFREVPMWADFWEELLELFTIVGIGVGLWLFRRQLGVFGQPRPAA
ncbi:MAG TPA: hypothetical protein PK668_17890 [Myxococcota bacterium]|nr:hypothetical protein [Myxococcota bacterium]HRY95834.1 hypothetical protein [Myxococcota bacterium]HSA23897.1 hypothetical protein [Myxococcota bacterium]